MSRSVWMRIGAGLLSAAALSLPAEPLPNLLAGTWKITRVLPTRNMGCWDSEQARPLVGSVLNYSNETMHWRGGDISLDGISTRDLTAAQFRKENSAATFEQLGIRADRVLEVDFQHEDMDITGASTEVPGDSVLIAGRNRIVVSACGVFLEAVRTGSASALGVVARR